MSAVFLAVFLAFTFWWCAAGAQQTELHVATWGSDGGDGSASSPFGSVLRALQSLGGGGVPTGGARVVVHAGDYFLNETLVFDSATLPGACADRPVVVSAAPNEASPRFLGGARLDSTRFRAVTAADNPAVWGRVDATARGALLVTDLPSQQGVADFGSLRRRAGMNSPVAPTPLELFCNDARMPLGRWPNAGYTDPADPLAQESVVLTGKNASPDVSGVYVRNGTTDGMPVFARQGLVNGDQYRLYRLSGSSSGSHWTRWFVSKDSVLTRWPSNTPTWWRPTYFPRFDLTAFGSTGSSGTLSFGAEFFAPWKGFSFLEETDGNTQFTYRGARPERWTTASDPFFHGLFYYHWADDFVPGTVDTATKTVSLDTKPTYGILADQPWFALNLLEEIDEPGEWYLDRTTGKLYFWPPTGGTDSCWVSQMTEPFASISDGVSGVRFEGLTFEYSRAQFMVTITGGSKNVLSNCTMRHAGLSFLSIKDSYNSGIEDSVLFDSGNAAIFVDSGIRANLTKGDCFVENCHVHSFSQFDYTYTPAIRFKGCGNSARHNLIHDSPHEAITFSGNEHLFELNEVHHVCEYSSDCGAIYSGRHWGWRGNVIRHNFVHSMEGFDPDRSETYVQGVYMDGAIAGIETFGNIVHNVRGVAFHISGGHDTITTNNIISNADTGTTSCCTGQFITNVSGSSWNFLERLFDEGVQYQQEPWASRYPSLQRSPMTFRGSSTSTCACLKARNSAATFSTTHARKKSPTSSCTRGPPASTGMQQLQTTSTTPILFSWTKPHST